MIIFILILSIAFPVLFLYCCILVASRADQEMELYIFEKDFRKACERFLEEGREKENEIKTKR